MIDPAANQQATSHHLPREAILWVINGLAVLDSACMAILLYSATKPWPAVDTGLPAADLWHQIQIGISRNPLGSKD